MRFQRLYPHPHSSAGAWKVEAGDHQYLLLRGETGWQLSCLAGGMSLLVKHGLLRQSYATRRDAVHCLQGMLLSREDQLLQD